MYSQIAYIQLIPSDYILPKLFHEISNTLSKSVYNKLLNNLIPVAGLN